MDDLISRQAAVSICDNAIDLWNGQLGAGALVAVRDAIKALPSADIDLSGFSDKLWKTAYERGKAEVVRCKDCKYFDSGTDEDGKLFFKCLGWVYGGTSEDDFCSHGERNDVRRI